MAKARPILKRRKAVESIHKITRTMQLIATARYQGTYRRVVGARPFTEGILGLTGQLAADAEIEHPLLRTNTESKHSVLIILTSNRGLCGGYNGAVLRSAMPHIREREQAGDTIDLHVSGKKGIGYFRFLRRPMGTTHTVFDDKPRFAEVEPIAQAMIDAYERRHVDSVYITYTRFESVSRQVPETIRLLPMEPPRAAAGDKTQRVHLFEFSPPAPELLGRLLQQAVKVRLFQCFIDAAVSEQMARMAAMKAATDAAATMIKSLTQQYNRARQSQITLELLDIVGGADALK
ncbi:MAG TPA: ATP synthase F1 subunit gamma [Phycisphaerae bacterium]|nr:ATP synthase F1 subunit gamma [Phycisphaerae bacterium]